MWRNSSIINYKALSDQCFGCFCRLDSIVIYRFVVYFTVWNTYLFLDLNTLEGILKGYLIWVILKLLIFLTEHFFPLASKLNLIWNPKIIAERLWFTWARPGSLCWPSPHSSPWLLRHSQGVPGLVGTGLEYTNPCHPVWDYF